MILKRIREYFASVPDMSISKLSKLTNLSVSTLSYLLNDDHGHSPTLHTICVFSEGLGVNPAYFFSGNLSYLSEGEKRLLAYYREIKDPILKCRTEEAVRSLAGVGDITFVDKESKEADGNEYCLN